MAIAMALMVSYFHCTSEYNLLRYFYRYFCEKRRENIIKEAATISYFFAYCFGQTNKRSYALVVISYYRARLP